MKGLAAVLLLTACSKDIETIPVTNTVTSIQYVCVDQKPFPLGTVKIKCNSKSHCLKICK